MMFAKQKDGTWERCCIGKSGAIGRNCVVIRNPNKSAFRRCPLKTSCEVCRISSYGTSYLIGQETIHIINMVVLLEEENVV